jgi:hypothetical protein
MGRRSVVAVRKGAAGSATASRPKVKHMVWGAGRGTTRRGMVTQKLPDSLPPRTMLPQDAWLCLLVWCRACLASTGGASSFWLQMPPRLCHRKQSAGSLGSIDTSLRGSPVIGHEHHRRQCGDGLAGAPKDHTNQR